MPTTSDPYTFLNLLLTKESAAGVFARKGAEADPLVITLSRDYYAGGELIARKLAECLGLPLYDQEILDLVAQKAKVERFKFEPHDENVSAGISTFLYSVLTGSAGELQTYRRNLFDVVLQLARKDALIVGRGAHLILNEKKVFRLRIVGSRLVCAKRLAEETGLPMLEAERKVYEINNKRHKSVQQLFGDSFEHASLEFAKNFDLVINTDHITPDNAVSIVLLSLRQAGFDLRKHEPKIR